MAIIPCSPDACLGDFSPDLWPRRDDWQQTREELWNYFQETIDEQAMRPNVDGMGFRMHLMMHGGRRMHKPNNCFSYASGLIANGLSVGSYTLAHVGVETLTQEKTIYFTSEKYDAYDMLVRESFADANGFKNVLNKAGYALNRPAAHSQKTAMIGTLLPGPLEGDRSDYHFIGLTTSFATGVPRIAVVEKMGSEGSIRFDRTIRSYFDSKGFLQQEKRGFGDPTLLFAPQALEDLKIIGTEHIVDKKTRHVTLSAHYLTY